MDTSWRTRLKLPTDIDALAFIVLVWAAQTFLLMSFIRQHVINAPYYDEWEMVPALTGHQPITLQWLWSQHNEHRIFLPRLVYLAVLKVANNDFRAGAYFNGVLLSGFAVAFCALARRLRGHLRYTDAFFPLLLLHCGQAENLIGSIQIAFVLGALISLIALLAIFDNDERSSRPGLVLASCAFSLPFVGGHGLGLVPALALCAMLCAWKLRKDGQPRRAYLSITALALASLALVPIYFTNYTRPEKHPVSRSIASTLRAALQFLAGGFGSGHKLHWPVGGYTFAFVALPCIVALCACALRQPEKRIRALNALLFLGAITALALGIGWARAVFYGGGLFVSRYVTLALPFLCAVYLSWELLRPSRWGDFMQVFLLAVLAVMVLRNRDDGYSEASATFAIRDQFRRDVYNRESTQTLAYKYCGTVYYVCEGTVFLDRVRMLRAYGIPGFAQLPD